MSDSSTGTLVLTKHKDNYKITLKKKAELNILISMCKCTYVHCCYKLTSTVVKCLRPLLLSAYVHCC